MLVDFVGKLKRKYLATAFSYLNGSPTSCNSKSAKLIVLNTWERHSFGLKKKYYKALIIVWQYINNKQHVKDVKIGQVIFPHNFLST